MLPQHGVQYLRSPAVCTALSCFLTFLPDISSCSAWPSPTAATPMVIWIMAVSFDIFHRFIFVVVIITLVGWQICNFLLHVDFLALEQFVYDLPELQVSG